MGAGAEWGWGIPDVNGREADADSRFVELESGGEVKAEGISRPSVKNVAHS
jgi:hypothetical protein